MNDEDYVVFSEEETDDEEEEEEEPFEPRVAILRKKEKVEDYYDVKEQLGKGRYGTVFRCVQKDSGNVWAAKYIRALKAKDREMARNELNVMNELKHPKLLQCVDAFETSNRVVMVMEYIAGGELFERVVDDDFDLTEKEVIMYMRQICDGVQHMHQRNYLHLDLKPENIMCVDKIGTRIKLIDFGMTKKLEPDDNVKVLFGTPEFVAPEVVNYERIGFPTDLWSLGVICYVLLSGLSPFMGDNDAETLNNVTLAEWDFEDEAFHDVSADARDFISQLLMKDKVKRRTIGQCLEHPWLVRKTLTQRQGYRLRGASLRLKSYVARRRWQKTATAVRAIGRLTALRLFSNLKKSTGQDPLANNNDDTTSLADLLKAKREEDALRLQQEQEQEHDKRLQQEREQKQQQDSGSHHTSDDVDSSHIELHVEQQEVAVSKSNSILHAIDSYTKTEESPSCRRRIIDTDTEIEADTKSSTTTGSHHSASTQEQHAEASSLNYGSDTTVSDRTSDFADFDRSSDYRSSDHVDFNRPTSDYSEDTMDYDGLSDTATAIQAVHRSNHTYLSQSDAQNHEVCGGGEDRFSGHREPRGEQRGELRERTNVSGQVSSKATRLLQRGDDSDPEGTTRTSAEKSIANERPSSRDRVTTEPALHPAVGSARAAEPCNKDNQKPDKITIDIHYGLLGDQESRPCRLNRSDVDYFSGGEKSSSDWTPRSSPCTSAGGSPSSSLLELDSWYKRSRIGSGSENHTSYKASIGQTRPFERSSRYDDRRKGPKDNVNSVRASLRSTGVDTNLKAPVSTKNSDTTASHRQAHVEIPSRLRIAELESKHKTRSSSEPPPEFQRKRELILNQSNTKTEEAKGFGHKHKTSKTSTATPRSRESYESAFRKLSNKTQDSHDTSARPKNPQLATKISVFSGTGPKGKTELKTEEHGKKIYAGREITVKSLPKVVVNRDSSHFKERPIESIRVNRTEGKPNSRLSRDISSDTTLADAGVKSSKQSGKTEAKNTTYLTEKKLELKENADNKQSGSALDWKIETIAKKTSLKSPRDLEEQITPAKKLQAFKQQHRRSRSAERALYPGQGQSSLASKIEKFSSGNSTSNKAKTKQRSKTHEPLNKHEGGQSMVADRRQLIHKREQILEFEQSKDSDSSTSQRKYNEHGVSIGQSDGPLPRNSRVIKTSEQKSHDDVTIPKHERNTVRAGTSLTENTVRSGVKIEGTFVSVSVPLESDKPIKRSDYSSSSSLRVETVNVTPGDLSTKPPVGKPSVAAITNTAPGKQRNNENKAAKPKANTDIMNRRGVSTLGGIGKLTAKFESNQPASSSKSPAKIEPVVKSRLSEKKQCFDGGSSVASTIKSKTSQNSFDYRDVLSSASKTKSLPRAKPAGVDPSASSVRSLGKSLSSRYQGAQASVDKLPVFFKRPRDQTCLEGGSVSFAVSFEGSPTPDISWHYKGRALRDEGRYEIHTEKDEHFLKVSSLESTDTGLYTCRLTNRAGRISSAAELKVTRKPKLIIPKGQPPKFVHRISDCELPEGEDALFECQISGDPSPEITWIRDGRLVREGTRRRLERQPDGTCALRINAIIVGDYGVYTCTAKNPLGMVSSTAELIVEAKKESKKTSKIDKIPAVDVLKSQKDSEPKRLRENEPPTFKMEKILTLDNKQNLPSKEEDKTVDRQSDEDINEDSSLPPPQQRRASLKTPSLVPKPPEFILRPRSQHLTPPETARFTCMVKGQPPPSVTWMRNTKVLVDDGRIEIYQDSGEHFLEIYETVEEDAGRYTCVIANELGKTTSSATISLRGKISRDVPPKFTQRLTNCRAKDGGTGRFSCQVSGEPAPTIQWLFLGKEISPDDDIYEIKFDGEKATLVLPEVLPEDEGEYECIARNRDGEVSCRARLSVEIPLTEPPEPMAEAVSPTSFPVVVPAEPVTQPKKKQVMQRQTSRTEIFLQNICSKTEDKEEKRGLNKPAAITGEDPTGQSNPQQGSSTERTSENVKWVSKPIQLSKPPQDSIQTISTGDKPSSGTPDPIAPDKTANDSIIELKLSLESGSESEPEERLRIVGPATNKQLPVEEPREEDPTFQTEHITSSATAQITSADNDVELVIHDIEADPDVADVLPMMHEPVVPTTKPEFVQIPSDVEVMDGSPLALTVKVKGTPEPVVMWIFDNCEILEDDDFKLLHDGDLHSLVIREVYPEDAGIYYCKAFNSAGVEQCSAKIVVKDPVCQGCPPGFTQKPRSLSIDEGSSLKLTCKVDGDPEPAISWSKDGRVISPGQRIMMKKIGIGNLRILQIPAVLSTDAGAYTCTISNANGEEKCTVSVDVHPIEDEEQTDFRQLLKSRPQLQNLNNNNINSSSTDRISPESDTQQLDFRHVLTRHVQTKTAPKFTKESKSMRVKEGDTAVFECCVESTPQSTIAWSVDGREIRESKYFKMTNEGTTVKLTITEAFPEDEGEYTCLASNTAGQAKMSSDLIIIPWEDNEEEELQKPPSKLNSRNELDEVFKRSLTISEDEDDDDDDDDDDDGIYRETYPPAITDTAASTKKSKKIPPPVAAKKPTMARTSTPSLDESTSDCSIDVPADREPVLASPQFSSELRDKRLVPGSVAVLECQVTGDPEPDIIWYRDGVEVEESAKHRYEFEGEHGVSLVINNATMSDCGGYTCKAINAAGSAKSSAQLVGGVPAKVEAPPRNIEVISGQTISISCTIAGIPQPEVTWAKNRKEVEESGRKHMDVTESSATLIIRQAEENDAGRYSLTVCNELGVDQCETYVSVVDKPDPPAGRPTPTNITRTSLTLSWSGSSYDGGSRITGYVVERCRSDALRWTHVTTATSTSHVIADLEPETDYLFRVSAENLHGVSEPSIISDPVRTTVEKTLVKDGTSGCESDDDIDGFVVHGDVSIRTDKEITHLYDIKEQCGKGRFGVVYRCTEKTTGKVFAAKFIKTKQSDRKSVREEIRIMNELHHPKLLQCVDAFEGPKQIVMVTEFIAGGELFERVIDDDFVLTEKDAIKFMRQICAGAHYMHEQNILHLDLKPENVMCVDNNGCRIKLIDFGLARKFDPTKNTKVMFGTPEFVAPEVINYEEISFATDMWSIGVICYILLSGLSPFMGDNDAETLNNVTLTEWDFEDEAFDCISDEAKDFIDKLLIKKKEKRMTNAQCLLHEWLNKDIKTMKVNKICTAKLKKFVARRRWQKTTTAVRAIGRMASLTMFAGLKKASEQSGVRPGSPTHSLLKATLRKEMSETTRRSSSPIHKESDAESGEEGSSTDSPRKFNFEETPKSPKELVQTSNEDGSPGIHGERNASSRNKTTLGNVNGFTNDNSETDSVFSSEGSPSATPTGRGGRQPTFSKDIVDAEVFEGDCARFDCRVDGDPEPEVTWYQDDEELEESRRFLMEFDGEGGCSLIIKNVCEDDDAEYMVKALNSGGEASSMAELIVHIPRTK